MYCAIVMSHLILARKRNKDDASNEKIVEKKLDQWIK